METCAEQEQVSGTILCNEHLDVLPYEVTFTFIADELIGVITSVGGMSELKYCTQ